MAHGRRAAAAATLSFALVLALLGPSAGADPRNPTPAELRAAQDRVAAARRQVASLQAQAEHAVEAYNGAQVAARRATSARQVADVRAAQALQEQQRAEGVAVGAAAVARAATAAALEAELAQAAAEAETEDAQTAMDRMVGATYRMSGQLGLVSQLLTAENPFELASGRHYLNEVSSFQHKVVVTLEQARKRAAIATHKASAAKHEAVAASDRAAAAVEVSTTARQQADDSRAQARNAAGRAGAALAATQRAKASATALVARAERALGAAVHTAAHLQRAAAEAKRQARTTTSGIAPSEAAATAIHWAFQEIGVPYSWGGGDENGPTYGFAQGSGTKGFDCSGLTLFAYAHAGIQLDHYTGSQWNQGRRISSRSDLLPGDLMFFAYDTSDPSTIHHVALFIGKGKMIEAPYTGEVVKVSPADRGDFIGGTRPWQSS